MNNEDETTNKSEATPGVAESTGSKFYATLVQLGVPGVVAAAILGAIYAALVALGVLSLPSCSVCVDVLPDGGQHWEGCVALPDSANVNPAK